MARTFDISGVSSKLFSGKYEDDEEEMGDIVLIFACFAHVHQLICRIMLSGLISSTHLRIHAWSSVDIEIAFLFLSLGATFLSKNDTI